MTANYTFAPSYEPSPIPEPAVLPELYQGLLRRRIAAYLIDLVCIGAIAVIMWFACVFLTVLSFGLLGPIVWFMFGLIPLAYHTLLLSGARPATLGMRCFGLELWSMNGERPTFLQALIQTALFYLTIGATCSLILLVALINRRKRTLHDFLAGTVMLRMSAMPLPRHAY
ncbi:MAG TPA: RDD family protein [Stellaceae bacterium]|nr:RDD family protein [Stellaceae bacterium]